MREKILTEARRLFARLGYLGFSMQELADVVGITKAAIYYYYADKESLFLAVLADYLKLVATIIDYEVSKGGDCKQKLHNIFVKILTQPKDQRDLIRLINQEQVFLGQVAREAISQLFYESIYHPLEEIVSVEIQAGNFKKLPIDVAVWSLLGLFYPYFYPDREISTDTPDIIVEMILDIYFDGISAECSSDN